MASRLLVAFTSGLLILQSASGASASLLELDLLTAGDGLITRDTETGLDWLDLTATLNLSYNDIEADLGGWTSLGFRHATGLEVCGLFAPHALAPSPCPGGTGISQTGNLVAILQEFVGVTFFDPVRLVASDGLYDDGVSDIVGIGRIAYSPLTGMSNASVFENQWFADTASSQIGHWLVRPVPEPSTALLLAAGLVGLGLSRSYRKTLVRRWHMSRRAQ